MAGAGKGKEEKSSLAYLLIGCGEREANCLRRSRKPLSLCLVYDIVDRLGLDGSALPKTNSRA